MQRREFVKAAFPAIGSSAWKDRIKTKCLERVKNHRARHVELSRKQTSTGRAEVADELRRVIEENRDFFEEGAQSEADLLRALENEILEELKREEAIILAEFTDIAAFEEEALISAVQGYEASISRPPPSSSSSSSPSSFSSGSSSPFTPKLLCPSCRMQFLHINKGVIFCGCGLRVDMKYECSLDYIQKELEEAKHEHRTVTGCAQDPLFTVYNLGGISTLCLMCPHCGYLHVVA